MSEQHQATGEFRGLWQGIKTSIAGAAERYQARVDETAARGLVDEGTTFTLFRDGTFTTKSLLWGESQRERLLGFEFDVDSMRRKSLTGRGAAALATAGASLLASNNRGVVYVTVTGENSGVRTFTTRNPSGSLLTTIRSIKVAADSLLSPNTSAQASPGQDISAQLTKLTELHATGALTDAEFAAAKARLLG